MLSHLIIRNFAIIDHLEIPFYRGSTVLTGETGAGKSIIIDALNLLLGGRASTDVIRSDEDEAVVEAIFSPKEERLAAINAVLEAEGIAPGKDLVVRRILSRSGRNKVFINGSLSTVGALQTLTRGLVDISGQHEHYSLFDVNRHVAMIDNFAEIGDLRDDTATAYAEVAKIQRKLAAIRQNVQDRLNRIDFLRFQLSEANGADLQPGEDVALQAEMKTLKYAERITDAIGEASYRCHEGPESAATQLAQAIERLEYAAQFSPALQGLGERLEDARIAINEVALELAEHQRDVDADPARYDKVVSRLELIKRLGRKFGVVGVDMIRERVDALRAELHQLENAEEIGGKLELDLKKARRNAYQYAHALSEKRRKAAKQLETRLEGELDELNMKNTRFVVNFTPAELPDKDFDKFDADPNAPALGANGFDQVEFLLAPNAGEEPRPMAKIASGGELSRIMLGFKTVLVERDAIETYVFDEVDTGIGGQTADVVGAKISATAAAHQVLCITHLPQIASRSDHHYLVEKLLENGRTHSRIRPLDQEERVEELARMLGGTRVSAKTLDAARDLLSPSTPTV
ncbi:DNA repair protein RecN [Bradymonas sediminis]|uniref:DNA repair protein RecN n=1 Tax=Bradymonas sediminis TaxID=1548548 RepID=A0A2Z4FQH4_9DELT|nr:DNA repair protein RecN [Bradymonas sediminis]AWV91203.1 DNA repair protein RecN [Bradymonas sediminis]TDP73768.1 DNA replication and repair protein RecN [Bradymonas sediminis]